MKVIKLVVLAILFTGCTFAPYTTRTTPLPCPEGQVCNTPWDGIGIAPPNH